MTDITPEKIEHYRFYLLAYGWMIMSLADSDAEILKLIQGEYEGELMKGLKDRVENSPRCSVL